MMLEMNEEKMKQVLLQVSLAINLELLANSRRIGEIAHQGVPVEL